MKERVQSFGRFLSGMVMPNIGAFIAWGLITALFIATGWLPNEQLSTMVSPMLSYVLPILIAYTGGKMVGGARGAVMGAIACVGVICGAPDYPMLMGAMLAGPLGGWVIKKFDQAVEGKIPAGFEMLVNNFSVGILGMLLAIVGFYLIGPLMAGVLVVLSGGVDILVKAGLLPLVSIFVEPAKVLFLNTTVSSLLSEHSRLSSSASPYSISLRPTPAQAQAYCSLTGCSPMTRQPRIPLPAL